MPSALCSMQMCTRAVHGERGIDLAIEAALQAQQVLSL